jgi:hypothetical protein
MVVKRKTERILRFEGRIKKGAVMEAIYWKMKKNKGAERRKGRQRTNQLKLERKWEDSKRKV